MKGERLKSCSNRLFLAAGKLFCLMHFEELGSDAFPAVLDLFSVPAENRKWLEAQSGKIITGKHPARSGIYEETFRYQLGRIKRILLEVEEETIYAEDEERIVMNDSKQQEDLETLGALNTLLSSYVKNHPAFQHAERF